ncbi:hypothetical protein GPECTOR_468g388 [Gonium pectorale]|uniref:Uncharacterized protein n=1 Tax=Gonium pectorale TaxID=33097 RepID=A0A150FV07_GONPE|nr:hypothetical protein GPECTOR_468g388 [Gonium pectorale]|eukprot:KXZ41437.1 hypothetical protein GPECTOR_468g388 [Gonium pectorale]
MQGQAATVIEGLPVDRRNARVYFEQQQYPYRRPYTDRDGRLTYSCTATGCGGKMLVERQATRVARAEPTFRITLMAHNHLPSPRELSSNRASLHDVTGKPVLVLLKKGNRTAVGALLFQIHDDPRQRDLRHAMNDMVHRKPSPLVEIQRHSTADKHKIRMGGHVLIMTDPHAAAPGYAHMRKQRQGDRRFHDVLDVALRKMVELVWAEVVARVWSIIFWTHTGDGTVVGGAFCMPTLGLRFLQDGLMFWVDESNPLDVRDTARAWLQAPTEAAAEAAAFHKALLQDGLMFWVDESNPLDVRDTARAWLQAPTEAGAPLPVCAPSPNPGPSAPGPIPKRQAGPDDGEHSRTSAAKPRR